MAQAQKEFLIAEMDLTGAHVFGAFRVVRTGFYQVTIEEATAWRSKEAIKLDPVSTVPTSVMVGTIITDGSDPEQKGADLDQFLGLDLKDDDVKSGWLTFYESVGMPPEMIERMKMTPDNPLYNDPDKGVIKLKNVNNATITTAKDGTKRVAYMQVITPAPGPDGKTDLKAQKKFWISKARYQRGLEEIKKGIIPTLNGGTAPAGQANAPAGGATFAIQPPAGATVPAGSTQTAIAPPATAPAAAAPAANGAAQSAGAMF